MGVLLPNTYHNNMTPCCNSSGCDQEEDCLCILCRGSRSDTGVAAPYFFLAAFLTVLINMKTSLVGDWADAFTNSTSDIVVKIVLNSQHF